MSDVERTIALEIFRYSPEHDKEPHFDSYEVPFREDWVILDAINYIKNELDGTVSYRWSCRMGVCGSCGMMINGDPKLSCSTFLKDYFPGPVRVEPLANFPVEKDLIITMEDFMAKLKSVKPWTIRKQEQTVEEGEYRQSPAQLALYKQYSMCINCLLCYAGCPVTGQEPQFVGPAALALAHRYNLDSRDQGNDLREEAVGSHEAVWECTFVGECSEVCPKNVDPASAIQQAKIQAMKDWYKTLIPKGHK